MAEYTGTVVRSNPGGVELDGGVGFLNMSKYRTLTPPPVGTRVNITTDNRGFIVSVYALDGSKVTGTMPKDRADQATRVACLKVAERWLSRPGREGDLYTIAEQMEEWVMQ